MWLVGDQLPRLTAIAEDVRSDEAESEHLLERIGAVRQSMAERRAARMNDILYVLTIVSTIMLPLTFITGLFGMNIGVAGASYNGMSSTLAFLAVCAALAILAWLQYRFLARRDLLVRARPLHRRDGATLTSRRYRVRFGKVNRNA